MRQGRWRCGRGMRKPSAVVTVALLLFGPALITAVSRRAGFVSAAAAVAVLAYLVLRNERPRN